MTDWQSRIVGLNKVAVNQLHAHHLNARRHPAPQRDALRGSLNALGIVAPPIRNVRTNTILDGHARVEEYLTRDEDMTIDVLDVDLSEDEEALFLASFDWITQLASYDRDTLDTLLKEVQTDDAQLQAMLSDMAASQGLYEVIIPRDEWVGMPEFEQEALNKYKTIQVVFETEGAMKAFARLVGQTITDKTGMIYYPARQQPEPEIYRTNESDES